MSVVDPWQSGPPIHDEPLCNYCWAELSGDVDEKSCPCGAHCSTAHHSADGRHDKQIERDKRRAFR